MKALYDLPAPAKLNLFLHVVGKRADGYHLLESLFVPIDWADTLHLEQRTDARIQRQDSRPGDLPAEDLCVRAARALQQASGCSLGVDIHLDKRLPAGAGMGGGSSDAATVLIGLNRLWGLGWRRPQLMALGLSDRLTPLTLPAMRLAVLKPSQSLPTAKIFASPLLQTSKTQSIVAGSVADKWLEQRNDLQQSAQAQCPEIEDALKLLQSRFGNSRMTGSGSAVFAQMDGNDSPMATKLEDFIEVPGQWEGRICRSLESLPLASWLED